MSDAEIKSRRERRNQMKISLKHDKKLAELLQGFFHFLDQRPKPCKEEVRSRFQKAEMTWKLYCMQHDLGIKTSLLFNARVAYEWERKYVSRKRS